MGIVYYEQDRIFKLDTPRTSYLIGVVDEEGFLGHIYYGKKVSGHELGYLLRTDEPPFVPSRNERDRLSFLDKFPMEYPTHGIGDFREAALRVRSAAGHKFCALSYVSHEIFPGKKGIEGLPASFAGEGECATLEILCRDEQLGMEVVLSYSVFEDVDIIARHVEVANRGAERIFLEKVSSMSLDMDNRCFEALTLHGSWAKECHRERRPLGRGYQGILSRRGISGHQDHPFMALLTPGTSQESGEVYGVQLVYSGSYEMRAEVSQFGTVRWQAGLEGEDFCWALEPGERFASPEALLTYSDRGLDGMTGSYHDFIRRHILRGKYKDRKRPILINNWEATYFDFDTEKLLDIAREASRLGIEMLVMDDGWFGNRRDEYRSLGDWYVNEEKLKGGLPYLVEEVGKLGMKFGIWFEPEMISPDSDLYRAHPDWAIAVPGRTPSMARGQYVLDLSRREVVDCVWEQVEAVLRSANVEYVKWDMNRPLCDLGSLELPDGRQGELAHRYMLGVYELQERLVTRFPDILLENCASGGGRFDAGMLYYSPQIWCSDDTDAIERLAIQEGTALLYPLSTIGAHVSDCPNHAVGRNTPFETRGYVALAGTFGYELDVTRIRSEDREMIPAQVALYHKYNDLIREGDYYRIASGAENRLYDCWQVVSKDRRESLLTWIQVLCGPGRQSHMVRLKGLEASARYRVEGVGEEVVLSGDCLMYAGLRIPDKKGDFVGQLVHLVQV
ncbi:alpha-galactosidase [uncultured Acetatifactor sp.]|uniref:alpha-galactosidase n=1 Tax=uncultured Acetatifactor sp. TaxID=1671927 RepID=UPI002625B5BB|nr:alpha-galactosidase [uncultured Acetatifactor sp.]